jgi:hypothetical protein
MVVEAVQNYVNMVNGLSRMTRDRALATAKALLAHAGLEDVANDASERVSKLAEEIMVASRANRELVENLVAAEVEKAAARWGFVRTEDVNALREEIADLRLSLARATVDASSARSDTAKKSAGRRPKPRAEAAPAGSPESGPAETSAQQPPLGGTPAESSDEQVLEDLVPSEPLPAAPGPIKSNADRRAAARKTTTPRKSAAKTAAQQSPAKKSAAKRSSAKSSAAQKSPAQEPASDPGAVAESLAPLSTFTPVNDPDAAE